MKGLRQYSSAAAAEVKLPCLPTRHITGSQSQAGRSMSPQIVCSNFDAGEMRYNPLHDELMQIFGSNFNTGELSYDPLHDALFYVTFGRAVSDVLSLLFLGAVADGFLELLAQRGEANNKGSSLALAHLPGSIYLWLSRGDS